MLKYYRNGSFTNVYKTQGKMFKEFECKVEAEMAWEYQDVLSRYNLAPEVYSHVKRIRVHDNNCGKRKYRISHWGYYTEIAETIGNHIQPCECVFCDTMDKKVYPEIQNLIRNIRDITGWNFVDNHIGNVGWITRDGEKILVCIDTGMQSFSRKYSYA